MKGQALNPKGKAVGTKNLIPKAVAEMVTEALHLAGDDVKPAGAKGKEMNAGTAYLYGIAKERPDLFVSMLKMLMPQKIDMNVAVLGQELLTVMTERRNQLAEMREINPDKETTNENA